MFEIDKDNLPFVRTRQALLVLDLQNEFVSSEGQLPVESPPHLVDNILKLIPDFRSSGNVIWISSVYKASRPVNGNGEDSEEVVSERELIMSVEHQAETMRDARKQLADSPNGQSGPSIIPADGFENTDLEADEGEEDLTDEAFLTVPYGEEPRFVLPQSQAVNPPLEVLKAYDNEKDIMLQKSHYSAFKDGTLIKMLRSRFITEIYICGALSNMSVYATALDAAQFGIAITLVDDCLGYRSKERHDETLRRLLKSTGCDDINSTDLIRDLRQRAKVIQKQVAPAPRPVRRQPSKQRERKVKEPALDSMMSKLNLTDGSSIPTGPPSSLPHASTPAPPIDSVPSLVADAESGGSFQSIESESHELELPTFLPRRRPQEDTGKIERVHMKIRSRKRPSRKTPTGTPSTSTDSIEPSTEKQSTPEAEAETSAETSTSPIEVPDDMAKKKDKKSIAKVPQQLDSEQEIAKHETGKVKPDIEKSLELLSLTNKTATTKAEQSIARVEDDSPSICEGDTTIITNLLKGDLAEDIFEKIRDEVRWQKMSHQGGDVPRLVAVQGKIGEDGSIPIYRHPADESPPLLPFSPTVSLIREQAERRLGHPLNHVLIQFYRDGTDYISEHSDKTLDIVPKTFIVNVSLGAQRTMIFRTKKKQNSDGTKSTAPPAPRESTRAPMPHNSMCKVGLVTNMRWLHGIRQDKRLPSEKSDAELAYGTARISLTFRQIGTFLSKDQQRIWGQGAVSKSYEKANFVINGNTPEAEAMIRAFGQENHSSDFDWAGQYGAGFDVLHLNNTPKLFSSGNEIQDSRVKLALGEYGIKWEVGKLSSSFKWKDGSLKEDAPDIPSNLPVKFVDNDLSKSTITGDMAILLYLDAVYGTKNGSQLETARLFTRLQQVAELQVKWKGAAETKCRQVDLEIWDTFAKESEYMIGTEVTIVDWMLLPILDAMYNENSIDESLEALRGYYLRLRASENVVAALGAMITKETSNKTEDSRTTQSAIKKQAEEEEEIIEVDDELEDDYDDDNEDE